MKSADPVESILDDVVEDTEFRWVYRSSWRSVEFWILATIDDRDYWLEKGEISLYSIQDPEVRDRTVASIKENSLATFEQIKNLLCPILP
jgi:hypothetical protein